MRLLKREQTSRLRGTDAFSLVNFDPLDIPSYAVLSHRWGPEEVTFRDLEDGAAETKAGFRKLKFCGEQASRDGLLYFWIDTCCIDKTSSAELSEAINSMFKWYQNATKCYVYLSDVSVRDGATDIPARGKWNLALEKSEWFTRGWTLQELIAPTVVEFFSVEGKRLGDKGSLERQIHQVTGISVEVLRGKPLLTVDEKERFSWAAGRRTTVEEDAAYCLLGIFGIHMSLIYGEGHENALARLKRKIRRSYDPNPPVIKNAVWIVPFERNPLFAGRESQLAELEGKLFVKNYTSRIAVTGLGGVGKTQIVLELLHRTKERHPYCSIMWIPAITIESLQQGYLMLAQELGIPGCEDEKADVKKLVQDHLSKEEAGQWLLVFDNADDIDLWTSTQTSEWDVTDETTRRTLNGPRRLIDYLPKSTKGCIIFTTRDRKAAVRFAPQNIIVVREFSEAAATQLLKNSLVNSDLMDDAQNVTALLAALTCLPLAITQAIAYINANEITLADYVSFLGEKEEETIEILSEGFEDFGRYQDIKNPVATTWLISFERIRRADPLAAEYLSFMACVNPRNIPQFLLPPGTSRKKEIEATGTLTAYSFVGRRAANDAFDMHRLVHLATRNWLRKERTLSQWMEKVVTRLASVFPNYDHGNRSIWRPMLPHVQQVLASDLVSQDGLPRIVLMEKYAKCLSRDGRWSEVEAAFTEIVAACENRFGEESSITPNNMAWLASTYLEQGRWKEAEQLLMKVIERLTTKLGADHSDTLSSMNILATAYIDQGRWEEAEQLNQQVLDARRTKLGADHPDTLDSMNNLAATYTHQNRIKEAEQLYLRILDARKMNSGTDHQDTLISMNNLAVTYTEQGRWEEAERLHQQVLEARKIKLGADHPDTLVSMNNLAAAYTSQGRWEEAGRLHQQVLDARKMKLGADHPNTLGSMHNVARAWSALGRDSDAMRLMSDCFQRRTRVLGAKHPRSLSSHEWLSQWKAEQSNLNGELGTGNSTT